MFILTAVAFGCYGVNSIEYQNQQAVLRLKQDSSRVANNAKMDSLAVTSLQTKNKMFSNNSSGTGLGWVVNPNKFSACVFQITQLPLVANTEPIKIFLDSNQATQLELPYGKYRVNRFDEATDQTYRSSLEPWTIVVNDQKAAIYKGANWSFVIMRPLIAK